jgi:nucleotide-binding universal stress UspA family protein
MSNQTSHLGIVVGVDDSPAAKVAVQWAARDAELRDVPLTLVHAISPEIATWLEMPLPPGLAEWQKAQGRQIIDRAMRVVEEACVNGGPARVDTQLLSSAAVPALVDLSKEAELIVVGPSGPGRLRGRLLGSVSSALVHHAQCPIAVIHDEDPLMGYPAKAPVLVGIDGSRASELATAIAFEEASRRDVAVVALHACADSGLSEIPNLDWPAMKSMADAALVQHLTTWRRRYPGVPVRRVIVADEPARQLLKYSESAQLVVVGSHGRGGFAGMLLGSVSAAVVHSARMPVIVARQPEA